MDARKETEGSKSKQMDYAEEFAANIIAGLKDGTAPWVRPWKAGEFVPPFNPLSGTVYKGSNSVRLAAMGYADPRWMTVQQANAEGWHVKKGSKSQRIAFWKFTREENALDESGRPMRDADGNAVMRTVRLARPLVMLKAVFHASQIEGGIPEWQATPQVWNTQERAERILQRSGAVIVHDQRNRAFYRPGTDDIHLPPKGQFPSEEAYYGTALHELAHWTGAPERLNREFGQVRGSEEYAREELRAEIASWMLCMDVGLPYTPDQALSYVDSWIKALENDPYEIVRACRDAEKIKEHILGFEKERELEAHVEPVRQSEEEKRLERIRAVQELMQKTTDPEELDDLQGILESYLKTPEQERAEYEAFITHPDVVAYREEMAAERLEEERLAAFRAHPEAKEFVEWLDAHRLENGAETPEQMQAAIKGYFAEHPGVQARLERLEAEIWAHGRGAAAAPPQAHAEPVQEQHQAVAVGERLWLNVPFLPAVERQQAKALGAKWDRERKSWYAPEGSKLADFARWLPEKHVKEMPALSPEAEFAEQLREAGLDPRGEPPVMDGKLHRVPLLDRPHARDGVYKGYLDGHPAGWFQNHVTGESATWKYSAHRLDREQVSRLREDSARKREEQQRELRAQYEKAAKRSYGIFVNAAPAPADHPYLQKKGVPPLGIKIDQQGNLLVPGRDADGFQHTLQIIPPENSKDKWFIVGSRKQGTFHLIDPNRTFGQGPILIAEGYATAASLHLATGLPVASAFDAGNLIPVAKALHEKFPDQPVALMADNDVANARNPGINKAKLAAEAVGGAVYAPSFTPQELRQGLSDWNDLHAAHGLDALRKQIDFDRPFYRAPQKAPEQKAQLENVNVGRGREKAAGLDMAM